VLNRYDALIFLGWNTYDEEDFKRLLLFVENGGTLLMTRAHLNTNLTHNGAVSMPGKSQFCDILNSEIKDGDSKDVVNITQGDGRIVLFDTDKYPANSSIRDAYEREMHCLGDSILEVERKAGWIKGNQNVSFTVWDENQSDSHVRRIFLLNILDSKTEEVVLLLGKSEFTVEICPGIINTVYISSEVAVLVSDSADVLEIEQNDGKCLVTLCAVNSCTVTAFYEGKRRAYDLLTGISTIELDSSVTV